MGRLSKESGAKVDRLGRRVVNSRSQLLVIVVATRPTIPQAETGHGSRILTLSPSRMTPGRTTIARVPTLPSWW